MQQQISPAVIVVVIIVVILVLIAMWHFVYGQQKMLSQPEGNLVAPGAGPGALTPGGPTATGADEREREAPSPSPPGSEKPADARGGD